MVTTQAGTTVTVLRLTHTGHVLGALTRVAPGPTPAVREVAGDAFPVAVPGASGLVLIPAGLVTVEDVTAPPGFLSAPWRWYVDDGPRRLSGHAPRIVARSGSLGIDTTGAPGAPVVALTYPPAGWAAGTEPSLVLTGVLGPDGTALMGDGRVPSTDLPLVFVRGRPVSVAYTVEIG